MAATIIDPRQLPLVTNPDIIMFDADGIVERVAIVGGYFYTTFFRFGVQSCAMEPIRWPVAQARRPIQSYQPNQLNALLLAEKERLARDQAKLIN